MAVFPTATVISSITSATVVPCSDGSARQEILVTDLVRLGAVQPNASSGAGTNFTIQAQNAGSGNSNGGNLVLVPGDNAGSGNDGVVVVRQPGGVAGTDEVQISHDGTVARIQNAEPGTGATVRISANAGGSDYFEIGFGANLRTRSYGNIGFLDANNLARMNSSSIQLNDYTRLQNVGNFGVIKLDDPTNNRGATLSSPTLTPAQITSDQNNYAPGVARNYRLSSDASRTITGLSISTVDGVELNFWNVGTNNIIFAHDSASSTAANRILTSTGANITLAPNERASLIYDSTSSRYRMVKG